MNDSAHSGADRAGQADRGDREDQAGRHRPILFFDGVCGLCNRFIDLMLRADRQDRFRYAPLQGETARRMLGVDNEAGNRKTSDLSLGGARNGDTRNGDTRNGDTRNGDTQSFVFLENDRRFERSNAVLHALGRLGGPWRLIAVLYVFPRPLRDLIYRFIARNRYRWFGRSDECRLPRPEERDRFLP